MAVEIKMFVNEDNKKEEYKQDIQKIYSMLWDLIALYEPTNSYNVLPKYLHADEFDDCFEYMDKQLLNVRKEISSFFISDTELLQSLENVVDEVELFIKSYEVPGVVKRWKEINENIIFFDCAFDLVKEAPDWYEKVKKGQTGIRLGCYPDEQIIKAKEDYFENLTNKCNKGNLKYSNERLFQNELHRTLELVFRNDFKQYLL